MQMADEPDNREAERDHENQKNDSAFPSLFAQGNAPSSDAAVVAPALVLKRDGNIKPAAALAGAGQQFLPLSARSFLGDARSFRDHRSEEHTSELQSRQYLVCRLLLEKKK